MLKRILTFLILIPLSALVLFGIYPILHEAGHALATVLLGGRIGGFSLTPLPSIESGLSNTASTNQIALISLAGMLFPVLICLLFRRCRGFLGFTVLVLDLISTISCVIEFCIALQFHFGDIVENDDIVLFLQNTTHSHWWAYVFTGGLAIVCIVLIFSMNPVNLLQSLPNRRKHPNGKHAR